MRLNEKMGHAAVKASALIGLMGLLVLGCALPKVPSSVSWDTELTVPLTGQTYRLADLADGDSVLQAEGSGIGMTLPDSALFFSYVHDLEPIHPGDKLELDPMDYQIERPMGDLRIPMNLHQTQNASLGVLNPAMAALHGTTADVPAFPFIVTMDVPLAGNFSLACADSGQINVRIQSTLPYAVSSADIQWMADRDNSLDLYSGSITSGMDSSYSLPLAGSCLTNAMIMQVGGMAAGGSQVWIDSTEGVVISISAGEMLANRFVGRLPRQASVTDSLYELNQQHETREGLISAGHLIFAAQNLTPFEDSVRLVFRNLVSPAGGETVMRRFLRPWESIEDSLDISGYTFRPNEGTQQIGSRLETVTLATAEDVDYQAGDQRVIANFRTDQLHFRRFEGVLHHLESKVEKDTTQVEQPPEGWENVHPAAVDMRLNLRSTMPVLGNLRVSMYSERQGNVIGALDRAADVWLGRDTTILFTGLSALMPQLPDIIGDSGMVVLDGPVVVYDTTMIRGRLEMTAPLKFTLDHTHVPGEVTKVEMDAIEDVQEMALTLRLWNALPVSGTVRLMAATDSLTAAGHSEMAAETLCTVSLPQARVVNGRVVGADSAVTEVIPPAILYEFLQHPPFYLRADLTLDGTEGDTLAAYGSDYVRFSATARVRYRISSEH